MKQLINKVFIAIVLFFVGEIALHAQCKTELWWEPENKLQPLWERLAPSSTDDPPIKLLHIGDSHLSGGYSTAPIISALREQYGDNQILVSRIGVPGATYATFTSEKYMNQIAKEQPDVVLVSLGTNDSYTFNFQPQIMRDNIDAFFSMLRTTVGDIPVILTTPPPSYLRRSHKVGTRTVKRKRRRTRHIPIYKTSYSFNSFTLPASQLLMDYARKEQMAYFDLRSTIGGEQEVATWLTQGLMNKDRVHYTRQGYTRMGNSIAEALIRSIESTISKTGNANKASKTN